YPGRGHARGLSPALARPERVPAHDGRDDAGRNDAAVGGGNESGPPCRCRARPASSWDGGLARPTCAYPARGVNGDITAGEIELPTRDDVVGYLRRQKLIPVKVEEKSAGINISFGSGIKTRDVVIFTRQFATMINSGLPLVQSLDILAKQ